MVIGQSYVKFEKSVDVLAFIIYSIIGSFVVSIEIPGFLLLSRFDDRIVEILRNLRIDFLTLKSKPSNWELIKIKLQTNKHYFVDLLLEDILEQFIESYERMNQIDQSLLTILLEEIGQKVDHVSNRSKHPFPKVIEILSLAGMSFIIAQFITKIM